MKHPEVGGSGPILEALLLLQVEKLLFSVVANEKKNFTNERRV